MSQNEVVRSTTPIIVDAGEASPADIRHMKRGKGTLYAEIADIVDDVHKYLDDEAQDKVLVPIIIVYERR